MTRYAALTALLLAANTITACHAQQSRNPTPAETHTPARVDVPVAQDAASGRPDLGRKAGRHRGADLNGDGSISREEFLQRADRQFGRLDANHDGSVTADEAAAARRARGKPDRPGRAAAATMTKAAFEQRATKRFDRMDTNGDGRLDATEQAAGRGGKHRRDRDGTPDATGAY